MNIRATAAWTPRGDFGQFIAANVSPAVLEATRDAGMVVLVEAQAIVPVDTGELRGSGRVEVSETGSSAVAQVIFDADHAAFVEYGTGVRGSQSPGAGPYPYNPQWPGMPAQPYLRPALDASRPEMIGEYALRMRQ